MLIDRLMDGGQTLPLQVSYLYPDDVDWWGKTRVSFFFHQPSQNERATKTSMIRGC